MIRPPLGARAKRILTCNHDAVPEMTAMERLAQADIFVSYTSSDCDWAFWLGKELTLLGHTPHIHEWEIKGGDDIYAWMQQHIEVADHVREGRTAISVLHGLRGIGKTTL